MIDSLRNIIAIPDLRKRIADFEEQTELAASTDFPPGNDPARPAARPRARGAAAVKARPARPPKRAIDRRQKGTARPGPISARASRR